MNKVDVLVGLQFGDEGKGKVINAIAKDYDVIVRYQGGANSGHTVYDDFGNKVVFNTIPSGMISDKVIGVVTGGCVIDPLAFMNEVKRVSRSVKDIHKRLFISEDAHITLPTHRLTDLFTEKFRMDGGDSIIGSTNRGNTPTYSDKVARRGIRLSDLSKSNWEHIYNNNKSTHINYIITVLGVNGSDIYGSELDGIPFVDYEQQWLEACYDLIKMQIVNTAIWLNNAISDGKKVLLEGAQGAMLDVDFGTYPYVTSSSVTASAAFSLSGIPPQFCGKVMGVFKPYITRVGNGFFPTEIDSDSDVANHLVTVGKEFGSVTGRKRKIGWIDIPQLKYACMINGVTHLIMAKCDVVGEIPDMMEACLHYSYEVDGKIELSEIYKGDRGFIMSHQYEYNNFGDLSSCREYADMPIPLMAFMFIINDKMSDLPTRPRVSMVSTSPDSTLISIPNIE